MAEFAPKPIAPAATFWTQREMLEVASRALGRIVTDHSPHGAVKLSVDETTAMAGTLIGLGLIATLPGEATPETLIYTPRKEA